jgi:hypothetical protein
MTSSSLCLWLICLPIFTADRDPDSSQTQDMVHGPQNLTRPAAHILWPVDHTGHPVHNAPDPGTMLTVKKTLRKRLCGQERNLYRQRPQSAKHSTVLPSISKGLAGDPMAWTVSPGASCLSLTTKTTLSQGRVQSHSSPSSKPCPWPRETHA